MCALILDINDLHIYFDIYEGVAHVLNGVNLTIKVGESVALVGETGCGKSITAKAILRILPSPPARIVCKEILFKGRDVLKMKDEELLKLRGKEVSMVFQDPLTSLNPVFTIGEQLMDIVKWQGDLGASFVDWYFKDKFGGKEKERARAKAVDMLNKVGMPSPEEILKRYPFELSGGMRQRVQIAMALITNPSLIIADEPGTALDVLIQDQIHQLLKDLSSKLKISMLFITHSLGVVRQLCQRIYIMYAGEIVEMARVDALFNHPMHPYTKGLLESIPKLTGEIGDGIKGRIPDYINPPTGCRFHPRCEYASAICEQRHPEPIKIGPEHFVSCHPH